MNIADGAGALAGGHLQAVIHALARDASLPGDELASIREHTRAPILLVASSGSAGLLEQALDADVAACCCCRSWSRTSSSRSGRRLARASGAKTHGGSQGRHGRIVTVFSPKGGTGKSVTATNLAAPLASAGRRVLLDLDLQFGDAAIMLGLEPDATLQNVVAAPGDLDADKLAPSIHHPSGLHVLPAPLRPEDAELVGEGKISQLLEIAAQEYEVVVIDTSPFFHSPMLAALDRTDDLLLLCTPDVPTLKNVRLTLQTLDLLSFPKQRIALVLNRANSKVGMKPNEVEGALGMKVRFEVPLRPVRAARR